MLLTGISSRRRGRYNGRNEAVCGCRMGPELRTPCRLRTPGGAFRKLQRVPIRAFQSRLLLVSLLARGSFRCSLSTQIATTIGVAPLKQLQASRMPAQRGRWRRGRYEFSALCSAFSRESEDTLLLMLKEHYGLRGVFPTTATKYAPLIPFYPLYPASPTEPVDKDKEADVGPFWSSVATITNYFSSSRAEPTQNAPSTES